MPMGVCVNANITDGILHTLLGLFFKYVLLNPYNLIPFFGLKQMFRLCFINIFSSLSYGDHIIKLTNIGVTQFKFNQLIFINIK